ncbi:hypothetical protein [uncultured Chryseobacterium sp.]|uniref:hypothetical protein n=1 Tax=uncultured Chryseobacterium sp. TaxID=259322 RepID=UPI002584D887|nr:hypothetical protein [uncultured Chryseobacterium sp.]
MKKLILIATLGVAGFANASNGIVKNVKAIKNFVLQDDDKDANNKKLMCRTTSNFMPCNGGSLLDDTTCGETMEQIQECEYHNYWLLVEFHCGSLMANLYKSLSLD